MPNIILDERVVPELLQKQASPEALVRELSAYLEDSAHRRAISERLGGIRDLLVRPDAADRAARLVLEPSP